MGEAWAAPSKMACFSFSPCSSCMMEGRASDNCDSCSARAALVILFLAFVFLGGRGTAVFCRGILLRWVVLDPPWHLLAHPIQSHLQKRIRWWHHLSSVVQERVDLVKVFGRVVLSNMRQDWCVEVHIHTWHSNQLWGSHHQILRGRSTIVQVLLRDDSQGDRQKNSTLPFCDRDHKSLQLHLNSRRPLQNEKSVHLLLGQHLQLL